MLKKLREKKTAKKIWVALAVVIVPAFIFWGFGEVVRSRQRGGSSPGTILGRRVSQSEFREALSAVRTLAIMRYGDSFSQIEKLINLESQAWDRLILLSEAKRRKINVTDKEVIETIENYPFFQRKGKFDNKMYNEMLQFVFRTQPRLFEEQTRQNIILSKLYYSETSGATVKEEEVRNEFEKQNQELSVYYVASLAKDFEAAVQPSEEKSKEYFGKNSLRFKQPLSFNLEYISLDSEEKAKEAVSQLNANNDFNKVASQAGAIVKETGLFPQSGPIPEIGWPQDILASISKLKPGESTPVMKADKFYYILRLKERKEPYIPEFEKIKEQVKESLVKEESVNLAKEKIEKCRVTDDFEKAVKECGLKTGSTSPFKFGSYVEGIGSSDEFWTTAKKLKTGEVSGIIAAPSGFYIIKLKETLTIDEKKFQEEKEKFSEALLSQKKDENFIKFLKNLRRKAQ
jgi:parvulin-like peptidyl-prolyl isomerase